MRITAEEYYDAEMQKAKRRADPVDADDYKNIAVAAIRVAVAAEREHCVMVVHRRLGDILREES